MGLLDAVTSVHDKAVFQRRIRVLARHAVELLPIECRSLLDVGCGDGAIDSLISANRRELSITGIDVFLRPRSHIPVKVFDGRHIPMDDNSCDVVMMIDVLHHTDDPNVLLAEAKRVARMGILIKDHTRQSWLGGKILSFMDWVGNRGHGVRLPYNYWSMHQWEEAWDRLHLQPGKIRRNLGLYPALTRHVFENRLHLMTFLEKR